MKIKIYCNYGVLAAEKRNVYTYGAPHYTATYYDEMTAEIPEGWETYENNAGDLMVTAPWGWNYNINEVLQGDEKPCFYVLDDGMKGHRQYLKIIQRSGEESEQK